MFQCAADADFFSLKGSATHSLQAAPPLRQKPAILVSQVKRLELLTDSDEPALVNIVGGILVALYSRSRWMDFGWHWFQNWLAARDRLGLPVQGLSILQR